MSLSSKLVVALSLSKFLILTLVGVNSLRLSLRLRGWVETSTLVPIRFLDLWCCLMWLWNHWRKFRWCLEVLQSVRLCIAHDFRSVDALRLVDDQTTLIHSDLLILSYLSKLRVAVLLLLGVVVLSNSHHLSELLVALLSKLPMLRCRGWLRLVLTSHRQLPRLSEIMGPVLWRKLERLHLLLRLERPTIWNVDLIVIRVCVGGVDVVLVMLLLHLSLLSLLSQVVSQVPVTH